MSLLDAQDSPESLPDDPLPTVNPPAASPGRSEGTSVSGRKTSTSSGSTAGQASASASSYLSYPIKQTFSGVLRRFADHPSSHSSGQRDSSRPQSHSRSRSRQSSHSLANGPAANGNGGTPGMTHVYTPPRLATPPAAPFQPPPLSPLSLTGFTSHTLASDSVLLSRLLAEEIRLLLPARLQLVEKWELVFSLERDGASLSTLFERCEGYAGQRVGFVLVVKDGFGSIFGAYLTDPPRPSNGHYYGTGECFLWRASTLPLQPEDLLASLPPPPSSDTTNMTRWTTIGQPEDLPSPTSPQRLQRHLPLQTQPVPPKPNDEPSLIDLSPDEEFGDFEIFENGTSRTVSPPDALPTASQPAPPPIDVAAAKAAAASNSSQAKVVSSDPPTPSRLRFKAFPYSGVNDYLIFCETGFLSVGGGDGHYGLWLDESLDKGVSEPCPTFGNEGLSEEGSGSGSTAAHAQTHGKFDCMGVEVWAVGA